MRLAPHVLATPRGTSSSSSPAATLNPSNPVTTSDYPSLAPEAASAPQFGNDDGDSGPFGRMSSPDMLTADPQLLPRTEDGTPTRMAGVVRGGRPSCFYRKPEPVPDLQVGRGLRHVGRGLRVQNCEAHTRTVAPKSLWATGAGIRDH
jgi:hypothetical protein